MHDFHLGSKIQIAKEFTTQIFDDICMSFRPKWRVGGIAFLRVVYSTNF